MKYYSPTGTRTGDGHAVIENARFNECYKHVVEFIEKRNIMLNELGKRCRSMAIAYKVLMHLGYTKKRYFQHPPPALRIHIINEIVARRTLGLDVNQSELARRYHVSEASISRFVKLFENPEKLRSSLVKWFLQHVRRQHPQALRKYRNKKHDKDARLILWSEYEKLFGLLIQWGVMPHPWEVIP